MKELKVVLVVHNVRSTHNVGSILRSADGFRINHVYFTGYSPYPEADNDGRLPHLRAKIGRQIHKTALGAEKTVPWSHRPDLQKLLDQLKDKGFIIAALEQTPQSISLNKFNPNQDIALIVGNEVEGLDQSAISFSDIQLEIPMQGSKESFNVAVAAAIAMYHLRQR